MPLTSQLAQPPSTPRQQPTEQQDVWSPEYQGAVAPESVWVRTGGLSSQLDAGRFGYDTTMGFVQVGSGFLFQEHSDGSREHAGIMLTFSHSNTNSSDSARALVGLATGTGTVGSTGVGFGGYYTYYWPSNIYVGVTEQISHYDNQYHDISGHAAHQNGYGLGSAVQVGKAFSLPLGWAIEPQAQLLYLHLNLGGMNDGVSAVSASSSHNVRGRMAVELSRNDSARDPEHAWIPFFTLGLWHDFTPVPGVQVADTIVRPGVARSWWDIGAGVSAALSRRMRIELNLGYQHATSGGYEGVIFEGGLRWIW